MRYILPRIWYFILSWQNIARFLIKKMAAAKGGGSHIKANE
jgi:hypothetical protein